MSDLWQVIKGVNAAMIGVGKREDLKKDFAKAEKSGAWPYIIVGFIYTLGFIGLVLLAVKFALS